MDYLGVMLRDPHVELWTIRDSRDAVFGFALTSMDTALHLHLICTLRRRGEGSLLFGNILKFAAGANVPVHLEAITRNVARKYWNVGTTQGFRVSIGGRLSYHETDVDTSGTVSQNGLPMTFQYLHTAPPPAVEKNAVALKMMKKRARRAPDSDSDSDGD